LYSYKDYFTMFYLYDDNLLKRQLDSEKVICYYSHMKDKITSTRPQVTEKQIKYIREVIENNPTWHRTKISYELCNYWGWCSSNGKPKDISCRDLLRELEKKGKITLPLALRRSGSSNQIRLLEHIRTPMQCSLGNVLPLCVKVVGSPEESGVFKSLLAQYHYLGFNRTVGENIKYLIYSNTGTAVSCVLFGSSAFSCAPRDNFIGWDKESRRTNLIYTTNNTRFLILPWVKIEHLASHVLGLVSKRIASDWQAKYGHRIYLLETFVQKDRFKGTCYKAANWSCVGQTTGRSRNDRYSKFKVPIKDIYLYPLSKNFKEVLRNASLT